MWFVYKYLNINIKIHIIYIYIHSYGPVHKCTELIGFELAGVEFSGFEHQFRLFLIVFILVDLCFVGLNADFES